MNYTMSNLLQPLLHNLRADKELAHNFKRNSDWLFYLFIAVFAFSQCSSNGKKIMNRFVIGLYFKKYFTASHFSFMFLDFVTLYFSLLINNPAIKL